MLEGPAIDRYSQALAGYGLMWNTRDMKANKVPEPRDWADLAKTEDVAVPAARRNEMAIWPHTRVAALLRFIYPKPAEHDPAIVAALSVLRGVWGLGSVE